jgi:hypothetical protein
MERRLKNKQTNMAMVITCTITIKLQIFLRSLIVLKWYLNSSKH